MQRRPPNELSKCRLAISVAVFVVATIVYWNTAYPTITWWDSSSYSLSAATLGVSSPPGSLLLTLIGWPVAKVFSGVAAAHALNMLAGILAALTIAGVVAIAFQVMSIARNKAEAPTTRWMFAAGVACGGLTFAFTDTMWTYSVKFTPYVLSALFTTFILLAITNWWKRADEAHAWRWLAITGFLFGIDFSVHRTNALLFPGFLICVMIRKPQALREWRTTLAGDAGILLGLSFQLVIIPIALLTRSPLNFSNPSNLSRFWDYISLKQLGGSFLLNLFPRKSDVGSVQVADVLHVLGSNFLNWKSPYEVLGLVPAFVAFVGLMVLARANKRLGVALAVMLFTQMVLTVFYFNIPDHYFRSFDRHYLPICVTIAMFMAIGFGAIAEWAGAHMARGTAATRFALLPVVGLIIATPIGQFAANHKSHDASKQYFAHDWARNALQNLPPNAIYFTSGDNDTFPLMYAQSVEGMRRDVAVVNISVAMMPGYTTRRHSRDETFPISANEPPAEFARTYTGARPVTYGLPTVNAGTDLPTDRVKIKGLYWQLMAQADASDDWSSVRAAFSNSERFRGFSDSIIAIDDATRTMALQYYGRATALLENDRASGDMARCKQDLESLFSVLPPNRLQLPPEFRQRLIQLCEN